MMGLNHKVILGLIFSSVVAVILLGTYFFLKQKSFEINVSLQNKLQELNATSSPAIAATPEIILEIYKSKNKNIFVVIWKNLPDGTKILKVYRSKTETGNWSLWKTVSVPPGEEAHGTVHIILKPGETTSGYSYYYAEAVDVSNKSTGTGGQSLWTTPLIPLIPIATLPPLTQSKSEGGGSPPPPANSPGPGPAPSPPSLQAPPQSASAPPSGSSGGTSAPNGIIYYTPQGGISGTGSPQTANFWVQIVNQAVEIGWQNLPQQADKLIVSRSETSTGGWNQILVQQNPVYNGPYYIRVADATLDKPYYYKMDVFSSGTIIATYGPLYLKP